MKDCKIVLDAMGSDGGVFATVKGAAMALKERADLSLLIVGDEEKINEILKTEGADTDRVEVLCASEVITNYDSPAEALFTKRDSSLVRALGALAEREDLVGLVNAGSTGALIAGAMRFLPSKERKRPALAVLLPAKKGGYVCLVDAGATVDCTPEMILHFAKLGVGFMKDMYGIESPRVGLLSNGKESTKGNRVVKDAHQLLLSCAEINFVGNMEGTDALSGDCDVLACDGFSGNQVLKVTEATAQRIIGDIVKIAKSRGKSEYMELVGELVKKYDFGSLSGGIILGVSKPVIKAHGSSDPEGIKNVIFMMHSLSKNRLG